ncbi:BNR repeat domain protein, partial [Candidatus Magnetomorum sp. HK-1]
MLKRYVTKQSMFFCLCIYAFLFVFVTNNANAVQPVIKRTSSSVSAGYNHSSAVTTDGEVWMWGSNYSGQLGIGTSESYSYTPFKVQIDSVIDIATSMASVDNNHSVALKSDGTVWTWGYNNEGQLGTGECCSGAANHFTPVQVSDISNIEAIDAGNGHSIALESNGTVWTWGKNEAGQLGNGSSGTNLSSAYHMLNFSDVTAIAAGGNHNLALKSDGSVWAWGDNSRAQLGDNTITNRSTPVQVLDSNATGYLEDIIAIAAGSTHSMALKSDGTVWVWGENSQGQAGQGSTGTTYFYTPIQVMGIDGIGYLGDIEAIAAGEGHNIALTSEGNVVAWGSNADGQLGDNSYTNRYYPVLVYDLTDVQSIDAGNSHNIVVKTDSSVWAWGKNTSGQLGDSSTSGKENPIQVYGPTNGYLSLGKYLPQDITMTEDTVKNICFSMTDAEGGTFSVSANSDGNPPVETFYFISNQGSGLTITVTLSANESIDITLRLTPALNQYGTDEVNIVITGDPAGVLSEQSSINVRNASDAPSIQFDNQWTVMDSGVTVDLKDIWIENSTHAYAVGYTDVIIEFVNDEWESVSHGYSGNFFSVWGTAADDVYVSSGSTPYYYNGMSWNNDSGMGSQTVHAIWGPDPATIYMVGDLGEIVSKIGTWNTMTSNTSQNLYGLSGNDSGRMFAVGSSGTIIQNSTGVWSAMSSTTANDLHGVWANDRRAYAVGVNGKILKYASGTWTAMNSGTSNDLYDIWGSSAQNLYAVGQDGIILHYDGNGWTEINSPTTDTLYAIDGLSENRLMAVGQNGTVVQYAPINQTTPVNATSEPIVLTINESDSDDLTVSVSWSNADLLTTSSFQIEDTEGIEYFYNQSSEVQALNLLITPITGVSGESVITITVTDPLGLTAVETFTFVSQQGPVVFQVKQNIGTGSEHSLAIRNDGQLLTWGRNERGELGLGTYGSGNEKSIPTQVDHTGRFIAVAGGQIENGTHSIALKSNGTVWTWGNNNFGQIGNASSGTNRYTPYEVENISNIVQVAAGNEHCLALNG